MTRAEGDQVLPGRGRRGEAGSMSEADAFRVAVTTVRAHYPEDIFPPDGKSIDCATARFARGLCDTITETAEALTHSEDQDGFGDGWEPDPRLKWQLHGYFLNREQGDWAWTEHCEGLAEGVLHLLHDLGIAVPGKAES